MYKGLRGSRRWTRRLWAAAVAEAKPAGALWNFPEEHRYPACDSHTKYQISYDLMPFSVEF